MPVVHVGLHGLFTNVAVTPVGRAEMIEKVTWLGEPLVSVATTGKPRDGVAVPWSNVTVLGAERLKSNAVVTVTPRLNVLLLGAWVPSPPYEAVIVSVLAFDALVGWYSTKQEDDAAPVLIREHGLPINIPVPLLAKLTVPNGGDTYKVSVSVTVTEQTVLAPICTEAGMQLMLVVVAWALTVIAALKAVVPSCVASP
jgi:hypothetical protein